MLPFASPADVASFLNQIKVRSFYAEFDVPNLIVESDQQRLRENNLTPFT